MSLPEPKNALKLPIDPALPEIVAKLGEAASLVLQASPGSGKTTRVPPALLRASWLPATGTNEIWVLEPRRVAAKYAARRVAEELGQDVGETVGYQFRFENVSGPRTRLRFFTEGMLMRRLLSDPRLDRVKVVVLDEFHERHLHSDLAIGYLRWLQKTARPDLKLIVMSATLEAEALSAFLGDAPVVKVEGRVYPVENEFLPGPAAKPLELLVRDAVQRGLREDRAGDVLVFLPGMGEIRRAADALAGVALGGVRVLPLHGELTREEQDLAIRRAPFRKVILSTNVAETSLTIDGVTTVVDSGLHRQAAYSWWSGIPSLRTRPISKASAIQRAGRAGRTAPGRCLRLYSQWEYEGRPAFEVPEIGRADLAQSLLELNALGIRDPRDFPWFQAPADSSLSAAATLLYRLGATDRAGGPAELTPLGRRLAALPAHPRLGRIVLEAQARGGMKLAQDAALLAAVIGEGRLESLDALENLRGAEMDGGVKRARTQLLSALERGEKSASGSPAVAGAGAAATAAAATGAAGVPAATGAAGVPAATGAAGVPAATGAAGVPAAVKDPDAALRFCLLTGFPDRVARKRRIPSHSNRGRGDDVELLFSAGGSARVEEKGVLAHAEDFVTLDIQETLGTGQTKTQLRVRCVSPIEPEWLFDLEPTALTDVDELVWDANSKAVVRVSRMAYDGLTLTESRGKPRDEDADLAADVLLREGLGLDPARAPQLGLGEWIEILGRAGDAERIRNTFSRAALIWKHFPSSDGESPLAKLWDRLRGLFAGKLTLRELAETDWDYELLRALVPEHADRIESLAPAQISLPGGRRLTIQYLPDQPPWVESRMQDFFGMKKGPALLNGRLPLTLHLLAPNYRAVQVTTDLEGFWQRGYQELRNQLSRRYPRHYWPEDPLQAEPPAPRGKR